MPDDTKNDKVKNTDEIPEEAVANEPLTEPDAEPTGEDIEDEYELVPPSKFERFRYWYVIHKKKTIPATVLIVLAIIFAVPPTRYPLLGLVLKKTYVIAVTDQKSNLPVSEVELTFRGQTVKTGADGKATLSKAAVGTGALVANKKYYENYSQAVLVPIDPKTDFQVRLTPTGRQVPFKVVNKITGKAVTGAVLNVADTQAKTDENGEANIVLPPDVDKLEGTITTDGYNEQKVTVTVSPLAVKLNTFQVVPAGKLYYLSKRTGVIHVMKANLDGGDAKVVLAGTGKESEDDTILLASRDWKYLALKARRDTPQAKVYLIDTATDALTEIDGSNTSTLNLVGWSNHRLVYQVTRTDVKLWENKRVSLKTYDAEKRQLKTLEETTAEGTGDLDYASMELQSVSILSDRIAYQLVWYASYNGGMRLQAKKHTIVTTQPDGASKQTLREFDATQISYIQTVQSEVGEIYYRAYGATPEFYTYENGKVSEDKELTNDTFNRAYPTFLISPASENTFWSEPRDGKNTLLVGNARGGDGKEIASLTDYKPYGWYSDNYVLVSKNGSELYILPSNGTGSTGQLIKITDYHKPSTTFYGYGYGYGGL